MSRLQAVGIIRHNTSLGGDLKLAIRELEALACRSAKLIKGKAELEAELGGRQLASLLELRQEGEVVALAWNDLDIDGANRLLRRSAFLQELIVPHDDPGAQHTFETACLAPHVQGNSLSGRATVAIALGYVIESEAVLGSSLLRGRVKATVDLLLEPFKTNKASPQSRRIRKAKKTTLSLSHDLHIYKAKFFPRMIRALLNIFGREGCRVVDPYCGSGTALLEAALLGFDSAGVDVDPICQMISRTKVTPFLRAAETLKTLDAFDEALKAPIDANADFKFPPELTKKIARRDRIDGTQYLAEIAEEAARLANAMSCLRSAGLETELLCVLASDAVTKKIRYRFVGVGNGKYTIEIVKQRLLERVAEKVRRARELCYVFDELQRDFGVEFGSVEVCAGDARKRDTWGTGAKADLIVTSPPYLPASSGREHYTASRALSFAILDIEHGNKGYYNVSGAGVHSDFDVSEFAEANRLMSYLMSDASVAADPQRDAMRFERKAMPTRQYLADMRCFFAEAESALAPLGQLLLVVANQHTFYSHRRQELEHIVACCGLYSEISAQAGLHLHEEIRMELLKSAVSKARPRASEDYFESILVMQPEKVAVADSASSVDLRENKTSVAAA